MTRAMPAGNAMNLLLISQGEHTRCSTCCNLNQIIHSNETTVSELDKSQAREARDLHRKTVHEEHVDYWEQYDLLSTVLWCVPSSFLHV